MLQMGQKGDGSPTHPVIGLHPGERISKERLGTLYPKRAQSSRGLIPPNHWLFVQSLHLLALSWALGRHRLASFSGQAIQLDKGLGGDSPTGPIKIYSWLLLNTLSSPKLPSSLSLDWENTFPALNTGAS